MKIAVISDIHGNLPALQVAITDVEAWQPDAVVVNGDTVNRGPRSAQCLRIVEEKRQAESWHVIRGNHEDYVIDCDRPDLPQVGPSFELIRFAYWTYQQLNGDVARLAALPNRLSLVAPDGRELRVAHASMQSNRDGIFPKTTDEEVRQKIAPPPAVFVTAHTHRPLIRRVDETLVVNVGSVGAPFDEDPRLSYGRFTWTSQDGWQAEIVRLPYNREQTERDFVETGFLQEAGPLAQLMLVELRKARGLIYRWAYQYEEAVLAEEISMEQSVRNLLRQEDVRPFTGPPGWKLNELSRHP